jgi:hypothetical protein
LRGSGPKHQEGNPGDVTDRHIAMEKEIVYPVVNLGCHKLGNERKGQIVKNINMLKNSIYLFVFKPEYNMRYLRDIIEDIKTVNSLRTIEVVDVGNVFIRLFFDKVRQIMVINRPVIEG